MQQIGALLRALRIHEGLLQRDVALTLGIERSTLANIEAGREGLSPRLRNVMVAKFPHWQDQLDSGRLAPNFDALNRAFVTERIVVTYVFGESASPNEVVQYRRIRAARGGADRYMLEPLSPQFQLDTELLWGGTLADVMLDRSGQAIHVIELGMELRLGARHEFCVRSWVERDPAPEATLPCLVTAPTQTVILSLVCTGTRRMGHIQRYGPQEQQASALESPIVLGSVGHWEETFSWPEPHAIFGLSWRWHN